MAPQGLPGVEFLLTAAQGPLGIFEAPGTDKVSDAELHPPFPDTVIVGGRHQIRFKGLEPAVGQVLNIELRPGFEVLVQASKVVSGSNGSFTWVGKLLDPKLASESMVVLAVRDGQLTGNIRFRGRLFHVRPKRERLHYVFEVETRQLSTDSIPYETPPPPGMQSPGGIPPMPEPWRPPAIPFPPWIGPFRIPWAHSGFAIPTVCSDFSDMMAGTVPSIRVLVVYTDAVMSTDGNVLSDIDVMLVEANVAYEESGISQRLELAEARAVTGYADTYATGEWAHLDRLELKDDGVLDDVHKLRDAVHADVTVLLVENVFGGGAAARADGTYDVSPAMEAWAFAVVQHAAAMGNFTLAHELGHIMGAQHDRANGPVEGKPYKYNFASAPAGAWWKTIMAISGAGSRVPRFSNPDRFIDGVATGVAVTSPLAADNRRALHNTAAVVAGFRLAPVWLVSAGAAAPWMERRVADEAVDDVLFGDLNGDGLIDAFRVDMAAQQWLWSPGAAEPWQSLNGPNASLAVPIAELRLVDLNGDRKADVFRSDVATGTWFWSQSGTAPWVTRNGPDLATLAIPAASLAFGDFDGDKSMDVFYSDVAAHQWRWARGGQGAWTPLNGAVTPDPSLAVPTGQLAFGDFDGDGIWDVFQSVPSLGQWRWSKSGQTAWATFRTVSGAANTDRYGFGDFDGDGATDVFKADGAAWYRSNGGPPGGEVEWVFLAKSCSLPGALRFGDFDGDGTTDVFRTGIRP